MLTLTLLLSCEKMMDVHKEWLEGGEIIYAPKVDSLVFLNGENRVQMQFWLLEAPNVRSVDVFWNADADSMIIPVSPSTGRDSFAVYIPLTEEKAYTFYVRTTDLFGNHSLRVLASASSYGDDYKATLNSRTVRSAVLSGTTLTIDWYGALERMVFTEVRYTDVNNKTQTIRTPASGSSTVCPNAKSGATVECRSAFIPENSADTFYLEWLPVSYVASLDKSAWTIVSVSDEQVDDGGGAAVILDGIVSSSNYWHSQWRTPAAPLPHWAIVDMKSVRSNIVSIVTYKRVNVANSFKTVQYYIGNNSAYDAADWTLLTEGAYSSGDYLTLPVTTKASGRYLKIFLPDSYSGSNMSMAEIYVYVSN